MRNKKEINVDSVKSLLARAIEIKVEGMKAENLFALKKDLPIKFTNEDFILKSKEMTRLAYLDEYAIKRDEDSYKVEERISEIFSWLQTSPITNSEGESGIVYFHSRQLSMPKIYLQILGFIDSVDKKIENKLLDCKKREGYYSFYSYDGFKGFFFESINSIKEQIGEHSEWMTLDNKYHTINDFYDHEGTDMMC